MLDSKQKVRQWKRRSDENRKSMLLTAPCSLGASRRSSMTSLVDPDIFRSVSMCSMSDDDRRSLHLYSNRSSFYSTTSSVGGSTETLQGVEVDGVRKSLNDRFYSCFWVIPD